MSLTGDMKNLAEDIKVSYGERVQYVADMVAETNDMMNGIRKDQAEMARKLRADLDAGEKVRLDDFAVMMSGIKESVKEIVSYTANLLNEFNEVHAEMSAELRASLANGEKVRIEDFNSMMAGIQASIKEIVAYTSSLLDDFHKAHAAMSVALKASLAKGEKVRLKDFNSMMKDIQASIKGIVDYTAALLKEFNETHAAMAVELRADLAKGEKVRLKDFASMMAGIQGVVKEIVKNTAALLVEFHETHAAMAAELKASLATGEKVRLEDFSSMMDGIQASIKDIFDYTAALLKEFNETHAAMAAELRASLDEGEKVRLEEFTSMMEGIQQSVKDIVDATHGLLKEYRADIDGAAEAWKNLSTLMEGLKSSVDVSVGGVSLGGLGTVKELFEKPEPVEEEPKPEPVVVVKAEPKPPVVEKIAVPKPVVKKKVEPKPEPVKKLSLEDEILQLVKKYPHEGLKVGEMEEVLKVSKLKLGKIAKGLLDEDKVRKVEGKYFPPQWFYNKEGN